MFFAVSLMPSNLPCSIPRFLALTLSSSALSYSSFNDIISSSFDQAPSLSLEN